MDGERGPELRRKSKIPLGLLIVSLLLFGLGRAFPGLAEGVYGRVFPWIAGGMALVLSLVPFSISELACASLLLFLFWSLTRGVRPLLWGLVWTLSVLGSSGILLWGLNHCRPPIADRLGWQILEPTEVELDALIVDLVGDLHSLESSIEDADLTPDLADLETLLTRTFDQQANRWSWLRGPHARIRIPLARGLLARAGISGIYSPWTGEAHVEGSLPAPLFWNTAAHEVAHQRGIAREEEANFIAWVVLRDAPDPAARYSARFVLLSQALGAMSRHNPTRTQDLLETLSPQLRQRRAMVRNYWRQRAGPLSRVSHSINDSYLKLAGHGQGILSYGIVLDLVLAEDR